MTEQITRDGLDNFHRLTSYDIKLFFDQYVDFIDNHYSNITNYYSAASNVNPTHALNKLSWLLKERSKIIDVVVLNSPSLDNYENWAILEYVENIGHALETANNLSRWLRSSITNDGYKQDVIGQHMASQGQALDDIERDVLKSNDWRNEWVTTAIQNELEEEDYTPDGGYLIRVIYKNNSSIFLNGVVDNINEPQKTYGKDINKRITFENDDLVVLDYKDTIMQSAEILTGLNRGDDPAYPDRGLNTKAIIGGNLAGISYPTIFRDLAGNFATDDSFRSFQITDVKREQDAIFLHFQVATKAGDVFSQTSQL